MKKASLNVGYVQISKQTSQRFSFVILVTRASGGSVESVITRMKNGVISEI